MWETTEDKVEFDAQIEERGEATLHQSKICYAFDIEQDLVIEIPIAGDSVARATLTPNDAAVLLRQICKVMEVEAPALPWFDAPPAPFTESDIPW
jgi:hypothetical protein